MENLEIQNVLDVYEEIASHFSNTRYKSWPKIIEFIQDPQKCPPNSLILDVGCGNGKNMKTHFGKDSKKAIFFLGCDFSWNLCKICRQKHLEVMKADMLNLPVRPNSFDAVISIAVLHHLSSTERRLIAIRQMVQALKPQGYLLITVWAQEQPIKPTWLQLEGKSGDYMIPWNLPGQSQESLPHKKIKLGSRKLQRYYHLFEKGELEELIQQIDELSIISCCFDRNNWYVECQKC